MRRTLTILTFCGLAVALLVASQMSTTEVSAQFGGVAQQARSEDRAPPDIKVGAKVHFIAAKSNAGIGSDQPATVLKVHGNWVYLKGLIVVEDKIRPEGWVNCDNVSWYLPAKQ